MNEQSYPGAVMTPERMKAMDALTPAATTVDELRSEYRERLGTNYPDEIEEHIAADFVAMRETLLAVQESHAALENRVVDLTEHVPEVAFLLAMQESHADLERKLAAYELLAQPCSGDDPCDACKAVIDSLSVQLGQRTDEFKLARAEALAAGYRQEAAERRSQILSEQLVESSDRWRAKYESAQRSIRALKWTITKLQQMRDAKVIHAAE